MVCRYPSLGVSKCAWLGFDRSILSCHRTARVAQRPRKMHHPRIKELTRMGNCYDKMAQDVYDK